MESLGREAGFRGSTVTKLKTVKRKLGALGHRGDKLGSFRHFDSQFIAFSNSIVSKEYSSPGLASF